MNTQRHFARSRQSARSNSGFTLIELLITVAVIAILAAIALPSYTQYVVRANRSAAAAVLMDGVQFMERVYSQNNSYLIGTTPPALPTGLTKAPRDASAASARYGVAFTATPTATAYSLTATLRSGFTDAQCGNLLINQAGVQSVSTTAIAAECWR